MPVIILDADQAKVLREASDLVELRDEQGQVLAQILPQSEAALLAEARRRLAANGPRYSSADVRARLQRLQELGQQEDLDQAKVRELLRKMRAGEQV